MGQIGTLPRDGLPNAGLGHQAKIDDTDSQ